MFAPELVGKIILYTTVTIFNISYIFFIEAILSKQKVFYIKTN